MSVFEDSYQNHKTVVKVERNIGAEQKLNKKGISVLVLLFSVIFLGISGVTVAQGDPHITIHDNVVFPSYATSGNGTAGNPWIIENKNLIAPSTDETTLAWIKDTTDHFIIRNCTFTGILHGDRYAGTGIRLENVANGRVTNCTFSYLDYAFHVISSSHLQVDNSFLLGPKEDEIGYQMMCGAWIQGGASNFYVHNNTLHRSSTSILIGDGGIQDSVISNNTIYRSFHGISVHGTATNVTVSYNIIILEQDEGQDITYMKMSNGDPSYGVTFCDEAIDSEVSWNDIIGFNVNAYDDAGNDWDYNLWSDYYGEDADEDGIGDTPHTIAGTAESVDEHPRLYTLSGEPYTPPARPTTPLPMIPSELLLVVTVIVGVCIIALVVIFYRKRKAP